MQNATCRVAGCVKLVSVKSRQLCEAHYARLLRYGDPMTRPVRAKRPTVDRFMDKVDVQPGSCWLWRGRLDYKGYGSFDLNGRPYGAHRVAYELLVGPIPADLQLDHLCRVHACVNPTHLEPVTLEENLRRGTPSPSAINRAKIACARGHPFNAENTYVYPNGKRQCRSCARVHSERRRERLARANNDGLRILDGDSAAVRLFDKLPAVRV